MIKKFTKWLRQRRLQKIAKITKELAKLDFLIKEYDERLSKEGPFKYPPEAIQHFQKARLTCQVLRNYYLEDLWRLRVLTGTAEI